MKFFLVIFLVLFLAGCGSSGITQRTLTETKELIAPQIKTKDSSSAKIKIPKSPVNPNCNADSIGQAYLEKYCRGTIEVDKDGLKAKINFYVSKNSLLSDSLRKKNDSLNIVSGLYLNAVSELEAKERALQYLDTTQEFFGYTDNDLDAAEFAGLKWGIVCTFVFCAGIGGLLKFKGII